MVFVTFHDKLMRSCNQGEVIYVVELQLDKATFYTRLPPMPLYRRITILRHEAKLPMFVYLPSIKYEAGYKTIWVAPH